MFLEYSGFNNHDVTVVNPLQSGHALTVRYNDKMTKHGDGCRLAGMVFIPTVALQESAVLQIKKLGAALARHTGGVREDQAPLLEVGHPPVAGQRSPLYQQAPQHNKPNHWWSSTTLNIRTMCYNGKFPNNFILAFAFKYTLLLP